LPEFGGLDENEAAEFSANFSHFEPAPPSFFCVPSWRLDQLTGSPVGDRVLWSGGGLDRMSRERLLTFLLLPAVVVSLLVLLRVTIKSSLELEELREKSIVEATYVLASDNADRLEKRIIAQDNAVRSNIDVTERERFGSSWLQAAAQQTPTVRAVLLLDLTSPGGDVVAFSSRGTQWEDERFRWLLLTAMLPDMKLEDPPRNQLRHLHGNYRGQDYLLSYWQEDQHGRRYLVVAWHYVPLIVHDLFQSLYSNRDPQSRVNVVDAEGRIIFGPPLRRGGVTIGRPFQTTLYKWWVNATILSAESLGEAVSRRQRWEVALVSLSLLVVISGLVIVGLAAVNERRLSNLKSDLVANVSHELKTPLSLVRMFGELLLSGRVESTEKRQQYLQIINIESERLGAIIDNLLDFSQAERGRVSYSFTQTDLAGTVRRAVEATRLRAGRVEFQVDIEPDLPPAMVDERAMDVAVSNLLDNAVKHAPDGRRVVVSLRRAVRTLELRVTDQGPGIPAEDRKRIFERFVRGKAATEARVRGSGIGLALVKSIAKAHGGKAWAEPAKPSGSTFVLSIRLA
jgi:two-component system, OmpR family, phosphate regulon sensor histidine kinase PhoR